MGCRVITGNETKGFALLIKASPSFVSPMLATRVQKLPTGPGWEYEVKWDGYRIVAVKSSEDAAQKEHRPGIRLD